MKLWVMAATLVCGKSVVTSCTSNDDNATEATRERVIAFEGIENGRDMGGLVMQDGRTVRFDMLVRSGNLATATDGDVAVLTNRFRLSDVFDFRFDAEVAAAPDREISSVTNTQLSTLPEAFIAAMSSGSSSSSQDAIDTRDIGALVIGNQSYAARVEELSAYLVNQLGFSEAEQQQLRTKYLTGK